MLSDYIEAYKEAICRKDQKAQLNIEKDLRKLGVDKVTLMILVKEKISK